MTTTAIKQAAYDQETKEVILVIVTIEHDDLAAPIRVVNNTEDITSGGDTYTAFPFDITLPDAREDAPPRARLVIDNVSREITQAIRSISNAATVTLGVIQASNPDVVDPEWPFFKLTNVKWDVGQVSGDLTLEDFTSEPFPAGIFSPASFPGL